MTKIKNITVHNYKALSDQNIDLNGCSVIVTGGNDKGKTSLLSGMIDRFQGEKPNLIVKRGEDKGVNTMELTDRSVIQWKFTGKTESFKFTTKDETVQTTGVLSSIGKMYFGEKFNIDKFIAKSNKEQVKEVQKLLCIDLTELDKQHKENFDLRTDANKELKRIKALNVQEPLEVEAPDIDAIKQEKVNIQNANTTLKNNWVTENANHQKEALEFNTLQDNLKKEKEDFETNSGIISQYNNENDPISSFINFEGISKFYKNMPDSKEKKEVTTLEEPKYTELTVVDKKLEDAYTDKAEFDTYGTDLIAYKNWVKSEENAINKIAELNVKLDEIAGKKLVKIKEANLPEDFEMTDDGILYKGFALDSNQISSSAKYIASLKLGSLVLGRIRTMHFDASFLDNISLGKIQDWADENDLQLLIERPDMTGGDIEYNIIEELS